MVDRNWLQPGEPLAAAGAAAADRPLVDEQFAAEVGKVALGGCEGGSRQEYAIYGIKDGGWCILTRAGEPKKEIPGMLNERLRRMPAGEEDHESTYQACVGLHNAYGLDGLTSA